MSVGTVGWRSHHLASPRSGLGKNEETVEKSYKKVCSHCEGVGWLRPKYCCYCYFTHRVLELLTRIFLLTASPPAIRSLLSNEER